LSRHLRRFVLSVEGLTPEAIACIVAIGLVFGVFPIFWCPTILCAAADAVAGWFCTAVPFGLLLYFTLIRLLRSSCRERFGKFEAHTPSL
jgi:hypothetical protein